MIKQRPKEPARTYPADRHHQTKGTGPTPRKGYRTSPANAPTVGVGLAPGNTLKNKNETGFTSSPIHDHN